MRIGILTLPLHTNYGGILQAYALQQVLRGMGHEAVVIDEDKQFNFSLKRRIEMYVKGKVKRLLKGKNAIIYSPEYYKQLWKTRTKHTSQFISEHIVRRVVEQISEISEGEFDAFVVGSDQIWRARYAQSFPGVGNAFLLFTRGWEVKRVSYAASFGTDKWEYDKSDTVDCALMAWMFDAISVREASGVTLCRENLGVDATLVVDPTLLLNARDYIKLIKGDTPKSSGNLMCYILDKGVETDNILASISQKKTLKPFHSNSQTENHNLSPEERIQPPVEQWLRGFYDAEFVVTDSFHACIFSILFGKPFVAIGNKSRGMARFESLLQMFGIEERLVYSFEDYKLREEELLRPIDNERVYRILEEKRAEATDFLKGALEP